MTDDDLDIDVNTNEEQAAEPAAKPSLKEAWESSPMLKIAAVVLGVAVLAGVYLTFFSGDKEAEKAIVRVADTAAIKQVPGQHELDPIYRKAIVEENIKTAKIAEQSGGSALPTPISTAKKGGMDMPAMPAKPKSDPLAEWRGKAQAVVKDVGSKCPRTLEERLQNLQTQGHPHCPGEEATSPAKAGEIGALEAQSAAAKALLDEARRRAAANGTTIEEELAKMAAEKALLDEAKRRALANGTTVEEELAKMAAEKALLDEAKRRALANGTTVEEELAKMAAEKALLDEAKRRALA